MWGFIYMYKLSPLQGKSDYKHEIYFKRQRHHNVDYLNKNIELYIFIVYSYILLYDQKHVLVKVELYKLFNFENLHFKKISNYLIIQS